MKSFNLLLLFLITFSSTNAQMFLEKEHMKLVLPDLALQQVTTSSESLNGLDSAMLAVINLADHTYPIEALAEIIAFASRHCTKSQIISNELSNWLHEYHCIYSNKSPSNVNQLRSFLIYALGQFPPTETLLSTLKYELQFSDHIKNIAAAANAAKRFPESGNEFVGLLNRYIQGPFNDPWIDITTYALDYPPLHPTKARYEIINTLKSFGADAYPSIKFLKALVEQEEQKQENRDTNLISLANAAISEILENTPLCCRKEAAPAALNKDQKIIPQQERVSVEVPGLILLDQEGNRLNFKKLSGKPFALTFFYTNCTNPLKCASTVDRLGKLQKLAISEKIDHHVSIYGMTFDADFDSPSVLKSYGLLYGLTFTKNFKFLSPQNNSEQDFFKLLNLRVNYGFGSVNQHGIQLYLFDKKGRLSAVYDNDVWQPDDVLKNLVALHKE